MLRCSRQGEIRVRVMKNYHKLAEVAGILSAVSGDEYKYDNVLDLIQNGKITVEALVENWKVKWRNLPINTDYYFAFTGLITIDSNVFARNRKLLHEDGVSMPITQFPAHIRHLPDTAQSLFYPYLKDEYPILVPCNSDCCEVTLDDFVINSEVLILFVKLHMNLDVSKIDLSEIAEHADRVNHIVRYGDYWYISYLGKKIFIKHSKGVTHIRDLLCKISKDIHCRDLAINADVMYLNPEARKSIVSDGIALTDWKTIRAARNRLEQISHMLIDTDGDIASLLEEKSGLENYLNECADVLDRPRRTSDDNEQHRKNVTRAIKSTIERIETYHPKLGEYLRTGIRTGHYCSFTPKQTYPRATWVFDA